MAIKAIEDPRKDVRILRKTLLFTTVILILALMLGLFVGCSKGEEESPTPTLPANTPVSTQTPSPDPSPTTAGTTGGDDDDDGANAIYFDFNGKFKDSALAGGTVTFTLDNGSYYEAKIEDDGTFQAEGVPKNETVSLSVKNNAGAEVATGSVYFWAGYDLEIDSSQGGKMEFGIPNEAQRAYLTMSISGNLLSCEAIHAEGFDGVKKD